MEDPFVFHSLLRNKAVTVDACEASLRDTRKRSSKIQKREEPIIVKNDIDDDLIMAFSTEDEDSNSDMFQNTPFLYRCEQQKAQCMKVSHTDRESADLTCEQAEVDYHNRKSYSATESISRGKETRLLTPENFDLHFQFSPPKIGAQSQVHLYPHPLNHRIRRGHQLQSSGISYRQKWSSTFHEHPDSDSKENFSRYSSDSSVSSRQESIDTYQFRSPDVTHRIVRKSKCSERLFQEKSDAHFGTKMPYENVAASYRSEVESEKTYWKRQRLNFHEHTSDKEGNFRIPSSVSSLGRKQESAATSQLRSADVTYRFARTSEFLPQSYQNKSDENFDLKDPSFDPYLYRKSVTEIWHFQKKTYFAKEIRFIKNQLALAKAMFRKNQKGRRPNSMAACALMNIIWSHIEEIRCKVEKENIDKCLGNHRKGWQVPKGEAEGMQCDSLWKDLKCLVHTFEALRKSRAKLIEKYNLKVDKDLAVATPKLFTDGKNLNSIERLPKQKSHLSSGFNFIPTLSRKEERNTPSTSSLNSEKNFMNMHDVVEKGRNQPDSEFLIPQNHEKLSSLQVKRTSEWHSMLHQLQEKHDSLSHIPLQTGDTNFKDKSEVKRDESKTSQIRPCSQTFISNKKKGQRKVGFKVQINIRSNKEKKTEPSQFYSNNDFELAPYSWPKMVNKSHDVHVLNGGMRYSNEPDEHPLSPQEASYWKRLQILLTNILNDKKLLRMRNKQVTEDFTLIWFESNPESCNFILNLKKRIQEFSRQLEHEREESSKNGYSAVKAFPSTEKVSKRQAKTCVKSWNQVNSLLLSLQDQFNNFMNKLSPSFLQKLLLTDDRDMSIEDLGSSREYKNISAPVELHELSFDDVTFAGITYPEIKTQDKDEKKLQLQSSSGKMEDFSSSNLTFKRNRAGLLPTPIVSPLCVTNKFDNSHAHQCTGYINHRCTHLHCLHCLL